MQPATQRYDLLRKLSAGGMGEVFLGRARGEHGFQKTVAVKCIRPTLARDAAFVDRFIAEAKLSVSLTHANIVQVLDLGRSGDELLLIMEYVHGIDARQLLAALAARGQRAPLGHVVYLVTEAAKGLAHAHHRGVVHLDVSPSNLLVSYEGEVKLADFGVAQALEVVRHRKAGEVAGKLLYMAPEQRAGGPIDARADLYALGVVARELCAGAAATRDEDGFAPIAELRSDVPAELARLFDRLVERDPAARPVDARALLAELTRIARALDPVTGPEVGAWVEALVPPSEEAHPYGLARALHNLLGKPTTTTVDGHGRTRSYVVRETGRGVSLLAPEGAAPATRRPWLLAMGSVVGVIAAWGLVRASRDGVAPPLPTTAPRAPVTAVVPGPAPPTTPPAPAPSPVAPPTISARAPEHRAHATRPARHPAPAPPERAWLNVYAAPWAHVFVDGRPVGTTPLGHLPLDAGHHRVRLVHPEHAPVERAVDLAPGKTGLVSVELP